MSPVFPVLAFVRDVGPYAEPGREKLTSFLDVDDFSTCFSWDLKYGERLGMTLVSNDLRCWKVVNVRDLGVVGPVWERVVRFLLSQSVHRIDHELVEASLMTLDEVKARAEVSVRANRDDWRDDELIAGEAGPPRDEDELLDEIVAAIFAAGSVLQIIEALNEA